MISEDIVDSSPAERPIQVLIVSLDGTPDPQ